MEAGAKALGLMIALTWPPGPAVILPVEIIPSNPQPLGGFMRRVEERIELEQVAPDPGWPLALAVGRRDRNVVG